MYFSQASAGTRRPLGFSEFVALMASLMAMTSLSIDVMLPALPLVREEYGLSDRNAQQLVVTLYVLGFGGGQLIYGRLSDRFGRKSVLSAGLGVYAAASFLVRRQRSWDRLGFLRKGGFLAHRSLRGSGDETETRATEGAA